MSTHTGDASSAYDEFIASEVDREHQRRQDLDERSGKTATTSAGLLTITVAAYAVVLGKDYVLAGSALYLLGAALFLFITSAAFAVIAGFGWVYESASSRTLLKMAREKRDDLPSTQRESVSYARAWSLNSLRAGNHMKARWLLAASIVELAALLALALSVISVLPTP